MRYRDGRRSVCVSSQSGCPLTCTFCATGTMSFGRNLTPSEILDQVLHFRRIEPVDHLRLHGHGRAVIQHGRRPRGRAAAARPRHHAPAHGGLDGRLAAGDRRLAESDMPLRLALSLHAPDDALRSRIMPVNDRYPIADVLAACAALLREPPAPGVHRVRDARRASTTRYAQALAARGAARPADLQGQPDPVQPDGRVRGLLTRRDRRLQGGAWRSTACARPCGSRAGATSTRPAGSWRRRRWRPPDRRGPAQSPKSSASYYRKSRAGS